MKLEIGVDVYPLPPHSAIRRVEVDFRTKKKPDEKHYPLVATNVATLRAARKVEDRVPSDPVYFVVEGLRLHVDPPPRREGVLMVYFTPPEEVA